VDVAEPIVSFINRDITRSEIVEADLDAFIYKRHEARVRGGPQTKRRGVGP
jgi:hypothetical protein